MLGRRLGGNVNLESCYGWWRYAREGLSGTAKLPGEELRRQEHLAQSLRLDIKFGRLGWH